jgi:hypothetical protein
MRVKAWNKYFIMNLTKLILILLMALSLVWFNNTQYAGLIALILIYVEVADKNE